MTTDPGYICVPGAPGALELIGAGGCSVPPMLSAFGEALVVEPTGIIQLQFTYNINTDYVNGPTAWIGNTTPTLVSTLTGSGAITSTPPFAVLSTTAAAGSALMCSKDRLHYNPGQGCATLFTTIFASAGAAGSTQLIGLGNLSSNTVIQFSTIQDGFFFGYKDGVFGILWYYNGTLPASYTPGTSGGFIPQSTWNVDRFNSTTVSSTNPSGVLLNPAKGNVYKIQYQWLGFGIINFFIENPSTGVLTLVHRIQFANANTTTSLKNPTMQLMAAVSNTAANALSLSVPSFCGILEGFSNTDHNVTHSISNGFPAVANITNTQFQALVTLRSRLTYPTTNPLTNQVMVNLESMSYFTSAGAENIITIFLNPMLSIAPTYTNISNETSVIEYDVSTAANVVTGGTELLSFYNVGGEAFHQDLVSQSLLIRPGDVLVLASRTLAGTNIAYASLIWLEEF
jgi:hypothetical protein